MTLVEQQQLFVVLVGALIQWATSHGYGLTFGEAYRTPEQASWNAQHGTGIAASLHMQRLAIDLNLWIDGNYQIDSAAYAPLGEYWEQLHDRCRWGGRFDRPDGNHFSLEWRGVR